MSSSPHAPSSPARSETSDSHAEVHDAFADLPAPHVEDGLEEDGNVDNPSPQTPDSPASSKTSFSDNSSVRDDDFPDLPESPIDNSGQHNDAGHHEHADDSHDNYSIVRDAFATLPALPDNEFEYSQFANMDFGVNGFTSGNHNVAGFGYVPDDLEQDLQLLLGSTQRQNGPFVPTFDGFTARASAQHYNGRFVPTFDEFIAQPNEFAAPPSNEFTAPPNDEPQVPDNGDSDDEDDPDAIAARIMSGALSPGQQARAIARIPEHNMDEMYHKLMRSHGFRPIVQPAPTAAPVEDGAAVPDAMPDAMPAAVPYAMPDDMPAAIPSAIPSPIPAAAPASAPRGTLEEHNYAPIAWEPQLAVDPNAPQAPPPPRPIYPAYTGRFQSGPDARKYRQRQRIAAKSQASDVERVKRCGRMYWVRRIYESMIDISNVSDSAGSIHRARFTVERAFDPLDLEAAAHHVFDEAVAVHERGWVRPVIYHKKVVRGKLTDVSEKCLERRLARICLCLQQKKATVDDALRGGVTLALLCDNPEARGFTKLSNNAGNAKRGERLRAAKEA